MGSIVIIIVVLLIILLWSIISSAKKAEARAQKKAEIDKRRAQRQSRPRKPIEELTRKLSEEEIKELSDEDLIIHVNYLLTLGEVLRQAKERGDQVTADAVINMTYTGPLPTRNADGTYTSIYDNPATTNTSDAVDSSEEIK